MDHEKDDGGVYLQMLLRKSNVRKSKIGSAITPDNKEESATPVSRDGGLIEKEDKILDFVISEETSKGRKSAFGKIGNSSRNSQTKARHGTLTRKGGKCKPIDEENK
jgi:hypothetical protein